MTTALVISIILIVVFAIVHDDVLAAWRDKLQESLRQIGFSRPDPSLSPQASVR